MPSTFEVAAKVFVNFHRVAPRLSARMSSGFEATGVGLWNLGLPGFESRVAAFGCVGLEDLGCQDFGISARMETQAALTAGQQETS